ncbi:MAG: class I SAM-dependent methyltransferase [Thiogranum sp.]
MDYPYPSKENKPAGRAPQSAARSSERHTQQSAQHPFAPYHGLARIYDRVVGDALFPDIWDSFQRSLKVFGIRFKSAADVGCGTGTFLRNLIRQHHLARVYGVDRSPAMLRVAAGKNQGGAVRLMHGHITDFCLPGRVDLITCNGDTLNYLLSARQLFRALDRCRVNLTPGGHLLFDLITGGRMRGPRSTVIQDIHLPDAASRWTVTTDPRRNFSVVEIRSLFPTSAGTIRRETEVHIQRWYPVSTIRTLLHKAGLTLRGMLDMGTHQPAGKTSTWVKFIARKI